MRTIDVFLEGRYIDQRHFDGDFYIYKKFPDPNNHTLSWEAYGDPDVEAHGGAIVWMQHADAGTRIAFVMPDWQLSIAKVKYPRAIYSNLYVEVPFTLTYAAYHFVLGDPSGVQRELGSKEYIIAITTKDMDDPDPQRGQTFTMQADHVGQALLQTIRGHLGLTAKNFIFHLV